MSYDNEISDYLAEEAELEADLFGESQESPDFPEESQGSPMSAASMEFEEEADGPNGDSAEQIAQAARNARARTQIRTGEEVSFEETSSVAAARVTRDEADDELDAEINRSNEVDDPGLDDASSVPGDDLDSRPSVVLPPRRPNLSGADNFDKTLLLNPHITVPMFPHGKESNGGWLSYEQVFGRPSSAAAGSSTDDPPEPQRGMSPARSMVFNMPKSMFRPDAERLRDMRSNMENQSRATNMNALFGLLWTPVAKGWKSGDHVEDFQNARMTGGPGDEDGAQERKKKREETVHQYMFYTQSQGGVQTEVPMFVVAYEELYGEPDDPRHAPTEVVGVRIWKFVRRRSDSN